MGCITSFFMVQVLKLLNVFKSYEFRGEPHSETLLSFLGCPNLLEKINNSGIDILGSFGHNSQGLQFHGLIIFLPLSLPK